MYCGLILSKIKNNLYITLVGTTNNQCSRYYSECKKISNNKLPSQKDIEDIFI